MNLYFELLKKPVFSAKDIADRYKKISGARSAIKELVKKGLAVKIRKNLGSRPASFLNLLFFKK